MDRTMNRDQLLNYLIREGADHYDQRIEWSNASEFSPSMAIFLLTMPFEVSKCKHCGEPIYHGEADRWYELTGIKAREGRPYRIKVFTIENGGKEMMETECTLDRYCYNQLMHFLDE